MAQAEAAVLQLRSFLCMDLLSQVLARDPTLLPESSLARTLRVHKAVEWGSFKLRVIKSLPFAEQTNLITSYWGFTGCSFNFLFSILQYELVFKYINCALAITLPKKEQILTLLVGLRECIQGRSLTLEEGKTKAILRDCPGTFKGWKKENIAIFTLTSLSRNETLSLYVVLLLDEVTSKDGMKEGLCGYGIFFIKHILGDWKMLEEVIVVSWEQWWIVSRKVRKSLAE